MLHQITPFENRPAKGAEAIAMGDYDVVRRAIEFLTQSWEEHPGLDRLADHLGLSPSYTQRLFKRWCGLSPKEFVQAIALDKARELLEGSASVLETAHEVGLSGGSRLHDLFVDHEAMSPGEFKRRGAGLELAYGFHPSPFGLALVVMSARGIASVAFADDDTPEARASALADLTRRWPAANFTQAPEKTQASAREIFDPSRWQPGRPVRVVMIGTDFEVRVWQALLEIPMGRAVTYSDIARRVGAPAAHRAVGSAVGRNPISFVVPCHRVLRKDGDIGGYHWGVTRKRAIIGWESGRITSLDG